MDINKRTTMVPLNDEDTSEDALKSGLPDELDIDAIPALTTTDTWKEVEQSSASLPLAEMMLHNNLRALADRQDLVFKGMLKIISILVDGAEGKSGRRTVTGKPRSVLSHRFDNVVDDNINQLADLLSQHKIAGNAVHLMQTKHAPKSATIFFKALETQICDDDHPLAGVVNSLKEDERAQTEFYVITCRAVKKTEEEQV